MFVKLSIAERSKLAEMLADRQGSFSTLIIFDNFVKTLALTEKEMKDVGFQEIRFPNGSIAISWNREKDFEKEIGISDIVSKRISDKLKDLDKSEQLKPDQMSLYRKIIIEPAEAAEKSTVEPA